MVRTEARQKPVTKIEVVDEPEIQYAATPELFAEVKAWLATRGAVAKKSKPEQDSASYYDTNNYRLLREGIEYRIKKKGGEFRHDMKTPLDTTVREVVPDQNDILWRKEMKFETPKHRPSLSDFFGQSLLKPVQQRVYKFFDKELKHQFDSVFSKEKFDHESDCKRGRVEYSFQTGYMQTPDKQKRTKEHFILELELRDGLQEGLLEEKEALEVEFGPKGLSLLPCRKIMLGFELLTPDMNAKQLHAYQDAKRRNMREESMETNGGSPAPVMLSVAA